MGRLMNKLNRFYRALRYGEHVIEVEFTSYLVKCQDVPTLDIYDCSECGFWGMCFEKNKPELLRYLKRNDMYKDGAVKRFDRPDERPDLFPEVIGNE